MVGFKQTDIGAIPENWNLISYVKAFNFLPTASYSKAELIDDGEYKYIHYGVIHTKLKHFIDFHQFEPKSIRKEQLKSYSIIKEGDVIMADASEDYSGICKSVEVKNIDDIIAISGLHTFLLRDKNNNFCNGFKGYLHSNRMIKNQFDRLATGLKVYGVSKGNLKLVQIPLPPLPEQEAIAEVLSDTDALITTLEKRIAKKRNIKQGAIQTLLTPQDDWEVKKLGEVASIIKGKGLPKSALVVEGKYKCIHYGELFIKYKEKIIEYLSYTDKKDDCFYSKRNDVLMPTSDVTPNGLATASCVLEDNVIIGGDILVIRIPENVINGIFLSYSIKKSREQVMKLVTGSTVYHIYGSDMANFVFKYPKIEEQNRIATILSDIDNEIDALEKKLAKTKKLKQGLMQQLLTGKIRLV